MTCVYQKTLPGSSLDNRPRQGPFRKCCKPGQQLRDVLQPVSEDYAIFNKRAKAIEIVSRLVFLDPSN